MDMMDTLEQFDAGSVPKLGGASATGLIDGPFVVDHNGYRSLGGFLTSNGYGVTFLNGSSLVTLSNDDYSLTVNLGSQTLVFECPVWTSIYTISPIDKGCMKEFWPNLQFADLDEFKAFLRKVGLGVFGKIPDEPELALAVADDDDSTVLGLYQYSPNNMQARQQGQWETLNQQSPEWDSIESGQWVPVLSGALNYWDDNEAKERLTADEFRSWVVGN